MSFKEFLGWLGFQNEISFWGMLVFLASVGIEIMPKIKWNPWSSLIKWIGMRFNSHIDRRVGKLDEKFDKEIELLNIKVDTLQKDLTKYVVESENKNLQDLRRDILDFCNSCINGRRHTREEFNFVIKECDNYEIYIKDREIKNGVIEAAIKEIRRLYDKCIQEHSFLKEGEENPTRKHSVQTNE